VDSKVPVGRGGQITIREIKNLRISRTRARCCSCNNAGVNLENATTPEPHRLPIDYPLAQPRFLSHLKRYREQTIYCSISIRDEAAASSYTSKNPFKVRVLSVDAMPHLFVDVHIPSIKTYLSFFRSHLGAATWHPVRKVPLAPQALRPLAV